MVDTAQLSADYDQIYARPQGILTPEEVAQALNGPWQQMIQRYLEPVQDQKILEIACGQGALSLWLNRQLGLQAGEVWSADFSHQAVEQCRDLITQEFPDRGGRVLQADMQQMPFETASFDVIVSCETLEHVPEPKRGLAELRRVLKPGGRLYLTTENYLNSTGLYRFLEEKIRGRVWCSGSFIQPIEHCFFAPSLIQTLTQHGFRIQTVDSRGHYLYFPRQPLPTDMAFLSQPGWHKALTRYLGRHLFIKAEAC